MRRINTGLVLAGCVVVLSAGACGGKSTPSSPTAPTTTTSAPIVVSIVPNSGPTTGGTAVTITGNNFAAGATVTIGGAAATNVQVPSATQITATTGAGNAGPGDVVVTVGGQSGRLAGAFTYQSPPPQLTLTTYYSGGEPDWSLFTGDKVPNGGAVQDPLGQKGLVWGLAPMGKWMGGWWPFNLVLSSPRAVRFEQFQSWSTDVMLTGTPPGPCPEVYFKLDYHTNLTGDRQGSGTAGVMLGSHPDGTFWVKGAWSASRTGEGQVITGPRVGFSRWYNIRMDIRVISSERVEMEFFLDGASFGVLVPPDWYAIDAVKYPNSWRNIAFWGCDDTVAHLANMQAVRPAAGN